MKKIKISLYLLMPLLLFCLYVVYHHFTYTFSYTGDTKDGRPILSPNGDYSAQVYYDNYGGAIGGVKMIVNIIHHQKHDEEQTIYFSDAKGSVNVNWTADDVLSITNYNEYANRNTELVVGKEIYDEQGTACSAYHIKKAFNCKDKDS